LEIAIAFGHDEIVKILIKYNAGRWSKRFTSASQDFHGGKFNVLNVKKSYSDGTRVKTVERTGEIWKKILVKELRIYPIDVLLAAKIKNIELGYATGTNSKGWTISKKKAKGSGSKVTLNLDAKSLHAVKETMHHEIWHCMQQNAIKTINCYKRGEVSLWIEQNPAPVGDDKIYIGKKWKTNEYYHSQNWYSSYDKHFFSKYSRHSAYEDEAEVWKHMLTNKTCWEYIISPRDDTPKCRKVTILLGNFVRRFGVDAAAKFLQALQELREWPAPAANMRQVAAEAQRRLEEMEKKHSSGSN